MKSIKDFFTISDADKKSVNAVVQNLKVIGEAANNLPDEFHCANDEIALKGMIGLFNTIIHHYFGVDLDILWKRKIVSEDLP